MKYSLATNIMGSFVFDANGKLIEFRLFPKEPDRIAEKLRKTESGEMIEEEKEILDTIIKKGYKEVEWDKKFDYKGIVCTFNPENIAKKKLTNEFRELALKLNWARTQEELNKILTQVNITKTKVELRKERKDKLIMHIIGVIDDLDKDLNVFSERLKEWYGLHFPESAKLFPSNEKFTEMVAKYGHREKIREHLKHAKESSGMGFDKDDIESVQKFSKTLSEFFNTRKELVDYLERIAEKTIPNISSVAGSMLGARLLAYAGGLDKMAKMPTSRVQLLGAEKSLFRHMKDKRSKPPKYGVIFGHPLIQNAPQDKKGKVARLLASKISLASKIDFFSKDNRGKELKKQLEKDVKNLKN